jgi:hypothetical protein
VGEYSNGRSTEEDSMVYGYLQTLFRSVHKNREQQIAMMRNLVLPSLTSPFILLAIVFVAFLERSSGVGAQVEDSIRIVPGTLRIYGNDSYPVIYRKAQPIDSPRARYPGFKPGTTLLKAGTVRREGAKVLPCDIFFERDVAVEVIHNPPPNDQALLICSSANTVGTSCVTALSCTLTSFVLLEKNLFLQLLHGGLMGSRLVVNGWMMFQGGPVYPFQWSLSYKSSKRQIRTSS